MFLEGALCGFAWNFVDILFLIISPILICPPVFALFTSGRVDVVFIGYFNYDRFMCKGCKAVLKN